MRSLLALLAVALLASTAGAQSVSLNGSLGKSAALLLIDGEPRTVKLGQVVDGVRLLALEDDRATVEVDGQRRNLVLGASPGRVGNAAAAAYTHGRIVLTSSQGGHYTPSGTINGQATQFLLDTGSTSVALSQAEAERLGLRFREGRRIMTQTANGNVPAHMIWIDSIRVGEVEVHGVEAIVIPGQMTHVLLGNTFLSRFQMRRDNDVMTLELRY
ncbi:MAG TPA: retropepsin-like aspartic protease [Burkholderiaceae bacterium]